MVRRASFAGVVSRSRPAAWLALMLFALVFISSPAAAQGYRVSHLAGPAAGGPGAVDGTGTAASFYRPNGVAVDEAGNAYVADTMTNVIRKVTPGGVVTTYAGLAGAGPGNFDGPASLARFYGPNGVAVDSTGTVYVADTYNHTIRVISPGGIVSTLAGSSGMTGTTDGTGTGARFNTPSALVSDGAGILYIADTNNHTIRVVTAAGVVTTFAGLGGSNGSADGTGTSARFFNPRGLARDDLGNLYVADTGNHTIRQITSSAVVTTVAGLANNPGGTDGTGTAARFNQPYGVALGAGVLLVAEFGNRQIRAITPAAVVSTLAGSWTGAGDVDGTGTAARFRGPAGIATDEAGVAYVVDSNSSTLRTVSAAGVVTTVAGYPASPGSADGTGTTARFNAPNGVAVDGSGNVYVVDTTNNTIRKITPAGVVTRLAGAPSSSTMWADGTGTDARFWAPRGIAAASDGTVYVADTYNDCIRKITPAAVVTTIAGLAGSPGTADGTGTGARFYRPYGLAVDASGVVYVADTRNSTIRKITTEGVVTTLAGLAPYSGSADGTGSAARFRAPYGITVDRSSNVFVADTDNHTVRKVTPDGVVTTLAGLPGVPGPSDGTGTTAHFSGPRGIAVDDTGTLYVSDTYNFKIRAVTPAGVVRTIAGVTTEPGNIDGAGKQRARFNGTWGIAVRRGQIFGADFESHAIRLLTRYQLADVDEDGRSDAMVYRPSTGTWFALLSETGNTNYAYLGWGMSGDLPAMGDFWGEDRLSVNVFRPSTGTWFTGHTGDSGIDDWKWFGWGEATDTLVQSDYDGDGITDAAVYRPSTGTWYVRPSNGSTPWSLVFGQPGDMPVPGDYDGDGVIDIAVYRPSSGTWFVLTSSSNFTSWTFQGWGVQAQSDSPVPGDYDGDGKTDYAVYRPAAGTWFVLNSAGGWSWWGWGNSTDTPMPGDYDGDGITDSAVFRASTGTWYVRPSSGGTTWSAVFGTSTDTPLRVWR